MSDQKAREAAIKPGWVPEPAGDARTALQDVAQRQRGLIEALCIEATTLRRGLDRLDGLLEALTDDPS